MSTLLSAGRFDGRERRGWESRATVQSISTIRRPNNAEQRLARARAVLPDHWHQPVTLSLICQRLKVRRTEVLSIAADLGLDLAKRPVAHAPGAPLQVPPSTELPAKAAGDLRPDQVRACQWPIGKAAKRGLLVCGKTCERGSYCAEHYAAAYVPVRPRAQP